MRVWISKYALTRGLEEKEGDIVNDSFKPLEWGYGWIHKGDWHRSKEEAINKANIMIDRKLYCLKKQIEQLNKLKF